MQFDPELGKVDRDGFITFLITLILVAITGGLPLMLGLGYVLRIAITAPSETTTRWLLVFGKRLSGGKIGADYRSRLERAVQLMQSSAKRHLLLMGGANRTDQISEAAAGEAWLKAHGLDISRLIREETSQNTLENLKHARKLLRGLTTESVSMVSNRYHLARIHTIAQSLGIPHQLCASEPCFEFRLKRLPRLFAEAWYILWFKTGKGWARLTGNRHVLERMI